ncbi:MAG TPA: hypothetical protein PK089_02195 [Methanoregulaceae archaeon]|nr:hypothetical protein [Methanoregulaceae archaeon]HOV67782.1 hypothetical protein [Methanoregulaceae archaeon]HQJ87602.1 hypothetical protein [Methanoregulaceae archaeon]
MFRCPSCGSRDIYPVAGGYLGSIYLCHACGYRGSLVIEDDPPDGEERD